MNLNLTLVAQALTFAAFIWFTVKFVWPHMLRAIETRQKTIADGLAAAEEGKRSLEMTQGGRVLGALQSILGQNKAFEWKDGMDRGFRRLTERFGQNASGAIDVVVGARPAGGAAAPAPTGATS